jgi:UDP-N-acetylmuramoyl-tripeptide--D-alanyl-D-alanine ligase
MKIAARDAAAAWGIAPPGDFDFDGVAVDSRLVRPGCLFVALVGARADGHDFLSEAFVRGARAALVARIPSGWEPKRPLFVVPDPLDALQSLAARTRRREAFRLAAITGSAGKTTTKELAAAIVSRKFRCGKTPGNLNSLIGFPMAMLNLEPGLEAVVGEMGMSTPGELSRLSRLFRPEVAAITNVAAAHAQNFPSLEAIADAKWEILDGLSDDGALVFNADDPRLLARARRYAGRKISFGFGPSAEVSASGVRPDGISAMAFTLSMGEACAPVRLPLAGRHQVANCLCAAAVAFAWGMTAAEVALVAESFGPPERRGRGYRLRSGALLVDDSYNSNPASLEAGLEWLREARVSGRRIALLGDMLELGPEAPRYHRQAGERAAASVDRLVCVGPLAAEIASGAVAAGLPAEAVATAATPEEAADSIRGELREGDLVWVKGSRGSRMDLACDALRG